MARTPSLRSAPPTCRSCMLSWQLQAHAHVYSNTSTTLRTRAHARTHHTHRSHARVHSTHSTLLHYTDTLRSTHSTHSTHALTRSLHSTPLHSTPLHSTPLHTTQHNITPLHSTPLHTTPFQFTSLHSTHSTHSLTHVHLCVRSCSCSPRHSLRGTPARTFVRLSRTFQHHPTSLDFATSASRLLLRLPSVF
jgi:hypothetical protein